jgi:two-component system response regulator FixJ
LLDSINAALALDTDIRCSSGAADDMEQRISTLTEREREVLDQILSGATSKEIARELGVSPRTVEAHRKNLLRKLDTGSIKELMLRLASRELD